MSRGSCALLPTPVAAWSERYEAKESASRARFGSVGYLAVPAFSLHPRTSSGAEGGGSRHDCVTATGFWLSNSCAGVRQSFDLRGNPGRPCRGTAIAQGVFI